MAKENMRGKINCRFVGGQKGEEMLTLPAMACRDTVALESDVWMAQNPDGTVIIVNSPRPPRAPWVSFSREVYEKVKPVVPGHVTYKFLRVEEVHRCEKVLEEKGRRCKNEAESGTQFCRVHKQTI